MWLGDMLDHRQVVRNEHIGESPFLLQVLQQVQDLGLNGHIQRGHRLVADDKLRVSASARATPMR